MRVLTAGAVLMATAALSVGATASAEAGVTTGSQPQPAATFTPPIGTNHGSVLAGDVAKGPNGYEMDLGWD